MKSFWIYTAMRLGLFIGCFAIIFGVWFLISDSVPIFWVVLIAFVVSGVASFFILERQRNALAAKVEGQADRASSKLEEHRSQEDQD